MKTDGAKLQGLNCKRGDNRSNIRLCSMAASCIIYGVQKVMTLFKDTYVQE